MQAAAIGVEDDDDAGIAAALSSEVPMQEQQQQQREQMEAPPPHNASVFVNVNTDAAEVPSYKSLLLLPVAEVQEDRAPTTAHAAAGHPFDAPAPQFIAICSFGFGGRLVTMHPAGFPGSTSTAATAAADAQAAQQKQTGRSSHHRSHPK